MSMYDHFRAPRYVDFANLERNDNPDGSSFFAGLENSVFISNGLESEDEKTLTPGCFTNFCLDTSSKETVGATSTDEQFAQVPSNGASITVTSTPVVHQTESIGIKQEMETESPYVLSTSRCREMATNFPSHATPCGTGTSSVVTPYLLKSPRAKVKLYDRAVATSISSDRGQKTSITTSKNPSIVLIPPTPHQSPCTTFFNCGEKVPEVEASVVKESASDSRRRRSKSTGNIQSTLKTQDCGEEVLLTALECLSFSSQKISKIKSTKPSPQPVKFPKFAASTSLSSVCKQEEPAKSSIEGNRQSIKSQKKRQLSPPPKNTRDYSQQPNKFVSVAEQIARFEKGTPTRFRTLPRASSSALRSARVSKMSGDGITDRNDIKVPRWPDVQPKLFTPCEYKPEELAGAVFEFHNKGTVSFRDRNTPLKLFKNVTTVQPFSFDERDKEIIRRRLERCKGENTKVASCPPKRRRSKSQGGELPKVLQKPPFQPLKPKRGPVHPLNIELNLDRRAKEREKFDKYLREKEEWRNKMLIELRNKEKLTEEKEIKKLRRELVHKASGVPIFNKFLVKPSTVPLTEPHDPGFVKRLKSKQT